MCQIVQDVRILRSPRDQGNVSNCTGCQNTQVTKGPGKCVKFYRMSEYSGFILVNCYTLGPSIFADVTGCAKTQMSECTIFTVYALITNRLVNGTI